MNSTLIFFSCVLLAGGVLSQVPSGFYSGFSDSAPSGGMAFRMVMVPTPGNGRASTGNRGSGPVLFPTAPDAGETSGVVVGASGYGFIPPGVMMILNSQGGNRAFGPSPPSSFSSFNTPFSFNFS